MELFVGIDFPPEINQELLRIQSCLRRVDPSGRYEPMENYHLTLRYFGESLDADTAVDQLDRIDFPVFSLRLHELGMFDNPEKNVVWVNVQEEERLRTLQQRIDSACSDAGSPMKRYSFVPHISLAYHCRNNISTDFPACTVSPLSFVVSSFHLYAVQNIPERPRFRKIKQFNLKR